MILDRQFFFVCFKVCTFKIYSFHVYVIVQIKAPHQRRLLVNYMLFSLVKRDDYDISSIVKIKFMRVSSTNELYKYKGLNMFEGANTLV